MVLLFFCWIAVCLALPLYWTGLKKDWRLQILAASALMGVYVVFLTEFLSTINLLKPLPVSIAWGMLLSLMVVLLILRRDDLLKTLRGIRNIRLSLIPLECILLLGMVLLIIATGIIARVAAPNNWDSMLYHLARVAHWQQNQNVDFFPAHNLKQLAFNPFSEYTLLQFHILSGSDYYDNLLQWGAMIIMLLGISYLTKQLGANRLMQFFAALFSATIPLVILQSTTTQNDLLLSVWLVAMVCFGLEYVREEGWLNAVLTGLFLGLSLLTKATAYIYVLPIAIWLVSLRMKKFRRAQALHGLVIILLTVGINLVFWMRNLELFGNILGPQDVINIQANARFSFEGLVLNIFRNLTSLLILPDAWHGKALEMISGFTGFLGFDLNDPRYTFPGYEFTLPGLTMSEDESGNLVHLLAIGLAFIVLLIRRGKVPSKNWAGYAITWVSILFLYSGYLRWQVYGSRLLLPWLILVAPLASIAFGQLPRWTHWIWSALLMAFTLPVILLNPTKPLWQDWNIFNLSRTEVMLRRGDLLLDYYAATDYLDLQGCRQIGLITDGEEWEYPLWALFRDRWGSSYRMENVLVENVSARLPIKNFVPCALIVLAKEQVEPVNYDGRVFEMVLALDTLQVFLP